MKTPKLVIAIAEGVEIDLLRREVARGSLPWWKRALSSGGAFALDCGPVPYEPSNLATAFSGVGPGCHGCFSYWKIHEGDPPDVLLSGDVKAERLWNWPELGDLRFGVVNVQLTHPPRPLNGGIVSYLMQQSLHVTWPPELRQTLTGQGLRFAHDVSAFYKGGPLDEFAAEIQRIARYQFELTLAMAQDCDVLVANFTIADRLSHFLWAEIDAAESTGRTPQVIESYRFLDRAFAELEALAGDAAMLVFTEMGFGRLKGFVSLDSMLRERGLQVVDGNGRVDPVRSLAREAVQGSHGLNLVLGNMPPAERHRSPHYDRKVEELCSALLDLRFSEGDRVLLTALPREQVYEGPWVHLAPDVVVMPADPERPPLGDSRWANHVRRDLQTGWHRTGGFGILVNAPGTVDGGLASLEQIAPTACRLLGRDVPGRCTAAPLLV